MSEMMLRTGEKLLPSIAYADAAGLGVETWTAHEIEVWFGYIDSLMAPKQNPYYSDIETPGMWSDDARHTMATAEGLIEAGGFTSKSHASALVRALEESEMITFEGKTGPRGWGGSTFAAVKALQEGVPPTESGVSGLNEKGNPLGVGNGVVMRMSPLVYWQVARQTPMVNRYDQYDAMTSMTHDTNIARACSRLHGDVLRKLIYSGVENYLSHEVFVDYVLERAAEHDKTERTDGELVRATSRLRPEGRKLTRGDFLSPTGREGLYAPQTLAMSYGAFILGFPDFKSTVFTAVNFGGDTDSTASVAAAMNVFLNHGNIELPDDAELLHEKARLEDVSRLLARTAIG